MPNSIDSLAAAISRLDRAISQVEAKLSRLQSAARETGDADADRARLAEELDQARASEAAMAEAAQEASKALGEAIEELRTAARQAEAAAENADGKVSVTLNGRAFTIGCEDGQESYLRELARHLDTHVTDLSKQVGQIGDLRLLLMASLVVVDELKTAQNRLEALESHLNRLKSEQPQSAANPGSDGLAEALNGISERLEALAADETP